MEIAINHANRMKYSIMGRRSAYLATTATLKTICASASEEKGFLIDIIKDALPSKICWTRHQEQRPSEMTNWVVTSLIG